MSDGGITNYFGQTYGWDVFAQGIIFTAALSFVLAILRSKDLKISEIFKEWVNIVTLKFLNTPRAFAQTWRRSRTTKKNESETLQFLKEFAPTSRDIIVTIIGIGAIYTIGIGVNQIADKWMDHWNFSPYYSLSTDFGDRIFDTRKIREIEKKEKKKKEKKDTIPAGRDLDYYMKIKTFDDVFPDFDFPRTKQGSNISKGKTDIYYSARHLLLQDDKWKGYVKNNQIAINLLQVTTLSISLIFLALLACLAINAFPSIDNNQIVKVILSILTIIFYSLLIISWYSPDRRFSTLIFVAVIVFTAIMILWSAVRDYKVNTRLFSEKFQPIFTLFLIVGILHAGFSYSWIQNEKEICYKTYGALRVLDPCHMETLELRPMKMYLYDQTSPQTEGH